MSSRPIGANCHRCIACVAFVMMCFSTSLANAQIVKTLTKDLEPIARSADALALTEFIADKVPVDRIVAYRYELATDTWFPIPFQIDQKTYRDFSDLIECIPGFSPPCACDPASGCADIVCEESYVWDGSSDPDDPGSSPNVLDGNDELAFMAKDTGDQAPAGNFPPGVSPRDRYEIRVQDTDPGAGGVGFVYLYAFSSSQSPYSPGYMYYFRDPVTEESIIEGSCVDDLIGYDAYQFKYVGNWSTRDLKTRVVSDGGGGTAACSDWSNRVDVLDRVKWRMLAQTEETWNSTSTYLGARVGPVRVLRGSIGARSGYGTTRYIVAYPTHYREEIHLRVHALDGNIKVYTDFVSSALDLGTGDPCPGSNFDVQLDTTSASFFDDVDGTHLLAPCLANPLGFDAYTSRQLNGPHASIAEVTYEDPEHTLPPANISTALHYVDNSAASLEPSLEDEAGAFGNAGSEWRKPNSTEETECPGYPVPDPSKERWAGLNRFLQIQTVGAGVQRATDLFDHVYLHSFEVTAEMQATGGGGGPSSPCIVDLAMNDPGNGFESEGSVSPCNGPSNDGLWVEIYRAGATGPFSKFRDLARRLSFVDRDVELGGTYRYYAKTYNSAGQRSAASTTKTVTISDVISPEAPVITGTVNGSNATLSWEFGDEYDLFGYNVYRSTSSGGPYVKLTLGGAVRDTSYTVQFPDTETYYFIVKAADTSGLESGPSNEVALASP